MEKITISNIVALVQKAMEKDLHITTSYDRIYFYTEDKHYFMSTCMNNDKDTLYLECEEWDAIIEINITPREAAIFNLLLEEVNEYCKYKTLEKFEEYYNSVFEEDNKKPHMVDINDLDDAE